jgi:hypothetical protein
MIFYTAAILRRFASPPVKQSSPLLALCVLALTVCDVWLIAGCAQSSQNPSSQNQAERPRRTTQPQATQTPDAANSKRTTNRTEMSETNREKKGNVAPFYVALEEALARRGLKLESVCDQNEPVSRRVLEDYGAMFLASETVVPPPRCVFRSAAEVAEFHASAGFKAATIGGTTIELQPAALAALLAAREEARAAGLDITPRGGSEAARRDYRDTVRLWNTRFLPALSHWSARGRLTREQVARLKSLPLHDQVREVLELEKSGIYFSKDLSKSILYSIAAPGTSQHMAMLALDVEQFMNARVRAILARHGWFQTVKSDLPHFTYLGHEEKALPSLGLRSVTFGSQLFWIPDVTVKEK